MNEQDYLAHHGVKGQTWGVRRRDYVPVGRSGGSGRPRHGAGVTRPNGINSKTAKRLSGADFDGDNVSAIARNSGSKKGVVKKAATAAAIIGALGGIGYLAATGRYSDVISYGKQAYNKISKFYKGVKVSVIKRRNFGSGAFKGSPAQDNKRLYEVALNRFGSRRTGLEWGYKRIGTAKNGPWGVGTSGRLKPGTSNALDYARRMNRYYQK